MSGIGRFVWHDLMTPDAAAARGFYGELFPEWTVVDVDMGGFTCPFIEVGGARIGCLINEPGIPSHWISYVGVEDCDATVARMEELGGKCCVPAFEFPGVGRFAVVNDPQGAFIKPFQRVEDTALPDQPVAAGQFCWDELQSPDIEAGRDFYAKAFGWRYEVEDMGDAGTYTLFYLGDTQVAGGMKMPPEAESPPNWLSYLAVPDVDERTAKADSLGAKIWVQPFDVPEVGRMSVLQDPTGATFALFRDAKIA